MGRKIATIEQRAPHLRVSTMANDTVAECIELNSDSDDDSSVLEVLPPLKKAVACQSSDSDSDDSLLFQRGPVFSSHAAADAARNNNINSARAHTAQPKKKLTKEEREEQRRREKERRDEEKRLEKLRKQEERIRQRKEKEVAKQAEQDAKRRRIRAAQQTSGKFASQEICILVEPALMQQVDTESLMEAYAIHPYASVQKGTIQWIRKDYTAGGAQEAMQALQSGDVNGYQLLDRMVIVFYDPKEFIQMLHRSDEDDDYPLLESWLESLHDCGKLVLLLHGVVDELNRQWNAHRRVRQNPPPPTDAELNDAIVWLLVQFQVECIVCPTEESLLTTIRKMTRALSEEPYQQQVTELECVKKIKSVCSDTADAYTKANDTWIRQLQQVPRVSENMARNLAQYFPTAKSLWDAYQDPSRTEGEKRVLLAPLFAEGRQHSKLSDTVYRLMTSKNPNEFL